MFKKIRIVSAVSPVILALLAGCAGNDPRFTPAETLDLDNAIEVNRLWYASSSGTDSHYSELRPAFAGRFMYAASRNGRVEAFDIQNDGDRVWRTDLSGEPEHENKKSARISGGVAVAGGRVAVGSENGYLYVLNADNGSLLWKKFLQSEIIASPAFSEDGSRLFVLDGQGNLSAFDALSGNRLWVTGEAPSALRLRAQSRPVCVGNDYVLTGTASGNINVILQSTGATVNVINVGEASGRNDFERLSDVTSAPLLLGNSMYASSFAGGLIEYDFSRASYKARLGYTTGKELGFDGNSIVLTADNGTVYCINRDDGSQRWSNSQLLWRDVTGPVVYGDYAVVGDFEGYVYFIDLQTGNIRYMDDLDSSAVNSAPQVYEGRVYVSTADGDIYCLSLPDNTGALRKEILARSELSSAGRRISLNSPGVRDSGIYLPNAMTQEELESRREAIKTAVARQEAQMAAQRRAYEKAVKERAEYEARVKAYEEERRKRLSGFGISTGIRSEIKEQQEEQQKAESQQ